jgi:L-amino acid N-acyltransferase YncA
MKNEETDMSIVVRAYTGEDLEALCRIWNAVVEEGSAFPQLEPLSFEAGRNFFAGQSFTGVAEENGEILGLYILHPNNVGRCGHIANSSYAVKPGLRGRGVGELLVRASLKQAASLSFRIMQFNAVVASNTAAIRLYEKLGFTRLGVIPGGFQLPDGSYEDIIPFYIPVV